MKELIKKFIPNFLISWYHLKLAFWGAVFYGFPSRKLKVIGVTGTSGKSTVVDFITKILKEAGFKTASISSVRFQIGEKKWPNDLKMTMPGRFKIQKFLRQAVKVGCQYAILEVTSEGIQQHRHRFIDFDVAVFTNLTPEHIERHGSFEKYRKAKGKLFQRTKKIHIVNLDDENADYFWQFPAEEKWGYGISSKFKAQSSKLQLKSQNLINAQNCQPTVQGIKFSVNNIEFNLKLLGEFNIFNVLAAISIGLSQGINLETCQRAMGKVAGIPGRMEIIIREPFTVVVDYAHTPDSLRKVYETVKNLKSPGWREAPDSPEGCISNLKSATQNSPQQSSLRSGATGQAKLICVLGACGGGRDKWKRPILGKLASEYCQEVIVTNEDPYDENPGQIIEEIYKGAVEEIRVNPRSYPHKSASIQKILNRRQAIKKALILAKLGDTIIITGKGCEPWMCIEKGKKIPWDDRGIIREEFKKINL